ncbi:MAG: HupE/UreJ family protein [Comamonadaceae bacterium]|jgi:urease accessory protein|uniref:Urease accessory protein UreJ n=1 Tax=Hydrogenophaga borbori TaxID=2294117 RepID=A0A372EI70_9BURK|nr:HupE/UreJ family protein [Hydrogenophaga borbori]NCT96999.1 HupE/UreJ family protein [Comamonadaceae bacterium]RFP78233.1 urease accessory protein UreJ [Hydrogenophaga borbori]
MTQGHWIKALGAAALAGTGSIALAHVGADGHGHHGFFAGLLHPITGPDHLAAMLAVGVWSAATTRRVWTAPLAFALTLLAGALLAQGGLGLPAIEPMIAASLLVVGLLLAARTKLPPGAGALLVGGFALFHGAAHGQELGGLAALAGMVAGTALLHGAGITLGRRLRHHSVWWTRAAGAVVALMGLNMGWGLLAG